MSITKEQIEETRRVLNAYKRKKAPVIKKRDELLKLRNDGEISSGEAEYEIMTIYKELEKSQERKEFTKLAMKTEDEEFELHFREIFIELFC